MALVSLTVSAQFGPPRENPKVPSVVANVVEDFKPASTNQDNKPYPKECCPVPQDMYFSKKITKSSLAVIGMQCGNKDHATVLHACKTIENLRQTDRFIRGLVDDLEKKFKEA